MATVKILLMLGLSGLLVIVNAQNPYCQICKYHTMCETKPGGSTCNGQSLKSKPPSEDEINTILQSHNSLRNKVAMGCECRGNGGPQPSAANMMLMKWDTELATIAQMAADQCVYDHDCDGCRVLTRDNKSVGQNVGIVSHHVEQSQVQWKRMVESFYESEVNSMSPDYVGNYSLDSSLGQYSQMVWWNSRLVGCGASMFKEGEWNVTLIFCNYRTGGNSKGAKIYEVGPPASNCPTGTKVSNSLFPALCDTKGQNSIPIFRTDGDKLGIPVYYSVVGTCEQKGFRISDSNLPTIGLEIM